MKHPMRKALTAVLAMAMPVCGGLMPGVQTAEAAQGRSSSSIYDSYITSIPLSDAAKHMAEAPVGGSTALIPAVSGKTVNVADYGANGGDRSSDTEAIQKAIQALGGAGTILCPAGTFYCADIKVPSNVTLLSMTTFGFDGNGATQLVRNKANASCILDLTGSQNVTVYGISIDGMSKSAQSTVHGVKAVNAKNILVANCRINACNGSAVLVDKSTGVTVRGSMLCGSAYGVGAISGSDILVYDNWLTSCHPAGYFAQSGVTSARVTANRIEWCGTGVLLDGASGQTIAGNYFDRCSIGGIRATGGKNIQMLGNINQRNGVLHGTDESCNLYLNGVSGAVYRGNVMEAIRGDGNDTNVTPETAMIIRNLKDSQIVYNTAYKGFTHDLLKDYGGHSGTTVSNNVGTKY